MCNAAAEKIFSQKQDQEPVELYCKLIEVKVEGAVENPGTYQVVKGTKISEVLSLAVLQSNASTARIKKDGVITRKRSLKIPTKKTVCALCVRGQKNSE